jgi:hypothetical protein
MERSRSTSDKHAQGTQTEIERSAVPVGFFAALMLLLLLLLLLLLPLATGWFRLGSWGGAET